MNDGNQALNFLYLIGIMVLVASALMVRRIPIAQGLKMAVAWALIFVATFAAFSLRDDFLQLGQRLVDDGRGQPLAVEGSEAIRIRQASDGHFWVTALINGHEARFLVDSGATITSISTATARNAGIEPSGLPVIVQTANGETTVRRGRAADLTLGSIKRQDLAVHISEGFGETNVLGMNFLSSLSGWGVEGRWLILKA